MNEKIKALWHNHLFMMVVCCVLPLVLLGGAIYFLGLSKSYLFWLFLLLCPLSHYFMMKQMHENKPADKKNNESKEERNCH